MTVPRIHHSLTLDEHGIWRAGQSYALSYPDGGNDHCLALEDDSFWFRHRNDCILAAVGRFPPPKDAPIVDVGGGNGFVAKRLHEEGFPVILVEPAPAGALNAKTKRRLPDVICATLEDVGFAADSVGAVGLFDVLEHIEDEATLLRHVHEVLCPEGLVYLTVPAHQLLWSASDLQAGHYRRYRLGGGIRCLDSVGFSVVYASYFFEPLVLPLFLLRSVPFRLGVSRSRNVLSSETEHGTGGGFLSRWAARLLRREVTRIRCGRRMLAGTSLLAVGQKRTKMQREQG